MFYLKAWLQISIKHCCSSWDILWNHWCLPAKWSERAGAEGWGKCLTSPVCSVQSFPLITDSAHEKFLDEKALRELAATEWAAKGKLFIPVFFPYWRKEVLSCVLYLCSLCRFAKRRCSALCLVIPIICFDFSRCIWNCQPLGFLLLYLDKVGLREVPLEKKISFQLVLALPCSELISGFSSKYFATVASHLYAQHCSFSVVRQVKYLLSMKTLDFTNCTWKQQKAEAEGSVL